MAENIGKVISISGPAVDVQFEESKMPPIFQALRIVSEGFDVPTPLDVVVEVQQHLGEGRVRCIAMVATEGMVRGMKAIDTGARHHGSRRPRDAGPGAQRSRRAGGRTRPGERQGASADSPAGSRVRRAVYPGRDVRDRHQGHRPDPALLEGRKDRPLRRRRRRQDRRHSGADQQRRDQARRLLGFRRRWRAYPRGQRPLDGVSGVGRYRSQRSPEEQSHA